MSEKISKAKKEENAQIPMSGELMRKVIHLLSLSIPIGYFYLGYSTTLWILIPLTLFALFMDYGRYYIKWIDKFVKWSFGSILREHERDSSRKLLSGGSYVLISACICILLFPKIVAITAFSILIISDTSSALIGRKFGKNYFLDKSLEGTTAFILSAWIVVLFTPKVNGIWQEYVIAFIAAAIGGIVEAMSVRLHVDDNFSIPLSVGISMWLGYFLLSVIDPGAFEPLYRLLVK
ncbi:MAG: dolichol kinase [Bacteroidota bacterium]|nr:dolichol kinase [Bacteroidota bacterium]MDP4229326.1 dolichol kinase [Bacteroidota bacterium]MDP4237528.1 dolichol kinase [Bacteroidota bacterium]